MRWEMDRVCTSEQIFDEIDRIAERPMGIVVFGVDCKCKRKIMWLCAERIRHCIPCQTTRGANAVLKNGLNAIINMLEKDSDTCEKRSEVASTLKEHGAKTVVGICIRNRFGDSGSRITHDETFGGLNAVDETKSSRNQNRDGLDYLVVIDSKNIASTLQ